MNDHKPNSKTVSRYRRDNTKTAPPINGIMKCQRGHQWTAVDLNPERRTVNCPVCGGYTSILQGLGNEQRK